MKETDVIGTFLLPSIESLADPEYQMRIWVKQEGPEEDSLAEWLEMFYEAYDLVDMEEEQNLLSVTQRESLNSLYTSIKEFHKTLRVVDFMEVERVLDHPKWQSIQKKAAETLTLLKNH